MILEILKIDGFSPAKKTATEYAGPCPFCGGVDRFIVHPDQGNGGRWWCRGCNEKGDAIAYMMKMHKMKYFEALAALNLEPKFRAASAFLPGKWKPSIITRATAATWTPSPAAIPPALWRYRLHGLSVAWSIALKNSGEGLKDHERVKVNQAWEWLEGRGISRETARDHGLGFCPWERWKEYSDFGLAPELKPDGTPKKFWLPSGLTIPVFDSDGQLIRVRVRLPEPPSWDPKLKYYILPGGGSAPLILGEPGRPVVIVESELDAVLLNQEAGDIVSVIALGSAQARPDTGTTALLREAPSIHVALDADRAGAKEALSWWSKHFPLARRFPPVGAKDPSDMFRAGISLRAWITAGLDLAGRNRPP